jgi:hypothetical protein
MYKQVNKCKINKIKVLKREKVRKNKKENSSLGRKPCSQALGNVTKPVCQKPSSTYKDKTW